MSQNYSDFGCVYFDTNILSLVVEHTEWYRSLFNLLFRNHLKIAFSDSLLAELSKATGKQDDFTTFFTIFPSAEAKSFVTIVDEEVKSYPKMRNNHFLVPSNSLPSKQPVTKGLLFDRVMESRKRQQHYVKRIRQQMNYVRSNFTPSTKGKYTKEQADVFVWLITMQWLRGSHPSFMKKLNDDGVLLRANAFLSIQLYAYYVYYKYYLDNKIPREVSEFSGLFHLFYFPYCKLIVVERDMCNVLNEIKSDCKVLDGVEVKNADFFSDQQY